MSTPDKPVPGKTFGPGWVGFSHNHSLLSRTIAHFTQWGRENRVTVSHAFLVTGEDECVEANLGDGVVAHSLAEAYLAKDDCYVFFRKPRGLTAEAADRVVAAAKEQVGAKFDYNVLANLIVQNNFLGWLANTLFAGEPKKLADHMVNADDRWICSELVAYSLQERPEYRSRGVLAQDPGTLDPQKLFEDDELFEETTGPFGGNAAAVKGR